MWRFLVSLMLLGSATGCGEKDGSAVTDFTLTSSAFANGGAIPRQYGCDGPGHSPPLAWSDPPRGTKSLALVVDDPDAPSGTFEHWGVFDIPAATHSVDPGQSTGKEAINGFGKPGYGAPCPPPGHGVHHYHFKLYALDTEGLHLPVNAKVSDVEQAAREHLVGQAELIGLYERT